NGPGRRFGRLAEKRIEIELRRLSRDALAQELASDGPAVTLMLNDDDLGGAALELEDLGNRVGDGCREAAAFLQRAALGDVRHDERHRILPYSGGIIAALDAMAPSPETPRFAILFRGGLMTVVSMTVNGKAVSVDTEDRTLLVYFLREQLRLTGT